MIPARFFFKLKVDDSLGMWTLIPNRHSGEDGAVGQNVGLPHNNVFLKEKEGGEREKEKEGRRMKGGG